MENETSADPSVTSEPPASAALASSESPASLALTPSDRPAPALPPSSDPAAPAAPTSPDPSASAAPPPATGRVLGFDLARSFAILTMVLINFQVYLLRPPSGDASEVWLRWLAHAPSGRSSATFVILAGTGIAQMSRRARTTGDGTAWWAVRRTLLLRALFLVALGNLLIEVWSIDILHFYAFYVLCAVLFVRAPSSVLLGSSALVVVLTTVGAVLAPELEELDLPYRSPLGMAANVAVNGIHPLFPWFAFVLYGMWLGRQDLGERARRRRFLVAAAASAVAVELLGVALATLAVRGLLPVPPESIGLLGTSWSPEPLYVLGACSTSTFAVALAHEIAARWPADRVVRALVRTGQLSLSIYLLHALVGVGIPRWVFRWENGLTIELVVAYWAVFVTLVVMCASAYRWLLPRGPVEAAMRWLTGSGDERGVPVFLAARCALAWLRAPRERGVRVELTQILEDAGADLLDRARDGWRAAFARSRSPAARPAPEPRAPGSMAGASLAVLCAAGALVVVGSRIVGTAPPTLGCPPPAALAIGESVTSQLTLLCPHVHFTLALDARSGLELSTRSGTDVLVEVHRADDGALVAADDDSGPGLDARLVTALPPGLYDVLVRPYSATSGPFVLSARAADASGGAR